MAVARFGRRTGSRRSSGGSRCGWGWHRACFWNGCGKSHDRLATSWNGPLRAAALAWRTEPATILDRAGRTGLTRCFLQTGPADFHGPPGFSFGEFQVFSFKFQGHCPRKRWGETRAVLRGRNRNRDRGWLEFDPDGDADPDTDGHLASNLNLQTSNFAPLTRLPPAERWLVASPHADASMAGAGIDDSGGNAGGRGKWTGGGGAIAALSDASQREGGLRLRG